MRLDVRQATKQAGSCVRQFADWSKPLSVRCVSSETDSGIVAIELRFDNQASIG